MARSILPLLGALLLVSRLKRASAVHQQDSNKGTRPLDDRHEGGTNDVRSSARGRRGQAPTHQHQQQQQQPLMFSTAKPSFLFMLIDDVGWADFSYNNGTARTPNIDSWISRSGSLLLQDMHSGGTVCSPTRATILTGRNHFRDCVDYVFDCSDMSTCVPNFEFAPSRTFTVGDAVRAAGPEYADGAYFAGKWHLGSFYNDSKAYGGKTSSPITHGFDHMNATVEVAPTGGVSNCMCKAEWKELCDFGHYHGPTHCVPNPKVGGDCCFNYWWDDPLSPHGVSNLTWPTPDDDAVYLTDAFSRFLASRRRETSSATRGRKIRGCGGEEEEKGEGETAAAAAEGPPAPFFAQISFHSCHMPFVGTPEARASCAANETCRPPADGSPPYSDLELDYYACLTQLDSAVGRVLDALEREGYYDNTMIWFASDNGPEWNCPPEGVCKNAATSPQRPAEGPGSAGPLRGRKRDIYEGGHRVPGAVSWPAVISPGGGDDDETGAVSWETVVTMDFLPTVMDALGIDRPPDQADWAFDGRSILPILQGGRWEDTPEGPRSIGLGYYDANLTVVNGWGFRHGKWKFVEGSASCRSKDCRKPQLFDLEEDVGERNDLSKRRPDVLRDLQLRFKQWHESVMRSRREESKCSEPTTELKLPESIRVFELDEITDVVRDARLSDEEMVEVK